jgi:phosphoribosylanthranilate isomerase
MRVRVKVCGLGRAADVDAAVEAGADAVGFVLSESPRRISLEEAARLAARLPPFVASVAVFRHPQPDEVRAAIAALRPHLVQAEPGPGLEAARTTACAGVPVAAGAGLLPVLHDRPGLLESLPPDGSGVPEGTVAVLLEADGRGGRGVAPDWERAAALAGRVRLVLAGGLTPGNVAEAIRKVRPYAVDVSSGVESSPGVKDAALIRGFIAAVRAAAEAHEAGGGD